MIGYPAGGGLMWVYLNWALGLREAGAEVIWLEGVNPRKPDDLVRGQADILRQRLAKYGIEKLVLFRADEGREKPVNGYPALEAATHADLLLNFQYGFSPLAVKRFKRTALLDIDPGMTQIWIERGEVKLTPHDLYFTIGERVPEIGIDWRYTPPVVCLTEWPVVTAPANAPLTAVSHWYSDEFMADDDGGWYRNDKRSGYLPFFDLPSLTTQPLELAICLDPADPDHADLQKRGWRVRHSNDVSSSPESYREYVQQSRGEFGCAKPAYTRAQGAWISDRTLCYLASGKPAVVQNTGPSRFLPDRLGLLRFTTLEEAAECVNQVASDYDRHAKAARALAEQFFDAGKAAKRLLEIALS